MFLNIIDKIIDSYITNLTLELNNNKKFNINNYINKLDFNQIKNIIKDKNDIITIEKIIINYIYIYNLLYKYYDNSKDDINNILLSEMNTNNNINNNIINSINKIIDIKNDLINFKNNNYNKDLNIYNNYEFIKNINIENYKDNHTKKSNILKYIIYEQLYYKYDKFIIYEIIEKQIVKYNNFKYIDIINNNDINYTYELLFNMLYNYNNINKNDVNIIYDLLNNDDNNKYYNNDLINHMFDNYSFFPITDEFLLINKNNLNFIKKKELNVNNNIAIDSILSTYNNAINYYNLDYDYNDIFDKNKFLKGININVNEQILIISKIIKFNNLNSNINHLYNDLYTFKFNPYVNFNISNKNKYDNIGFNHLFKNMIRSVRLSNIEFKNNDLLNIRNIGENIDANVVGFVLVPNNCSNYKSLLYDSSNLKKLDIDNLYDTLKSLNNNKYIYYYLFDKSKYSNLENNINIQSNIKNDMYKIFNVIQKYIYKYTKKIIKKANKDIIIYYFNNNSFNLNLKKLYNILNDKNYIIELIDHYYISNINKIILNKINSFNIFKDHNFNLNEYKIKIPTIIGSNKNKIIIKKSKDNIINNDDITCYHIIYQKYIEQYRKNNNLDKYYEKLNEYILKFGIDSNYGELICKSCNSILDIKKYSTFTYNDTDGIISYNYVLDNKEKYNKYSNYIEIIDSILRKLCIFCNINYLLQPENKKIKQDLIYLVIDIILLLYNKFYNLYQNYKDIKTFNIISSKFIIFDINKNFDIKSEHWNIIYNNIVVITTFIFILQINSSNINNLPFNSKYNFTIFNLYSKSFFNDINIIYDKNHNLKLISDYKVLSYIIYYIANSCVKYNLWYNFKYDKNQENLNIKIFINTIIDFINFILYHNINDNNVNNCINKFIHYFNNIFNNTNIIYNLSNKEINKISLSDGKLIIKKNIILHNDISLSYTNTVGIIEYMKYNSHIFNYCKKLIFKNEIYKLPSNDIKLLYNNLININNINIYNNYNIEGIKQNNSNTFDINIFNKIITNINKNKINLNNKLNINIYNNLKKNNKTFTSNISFTNKLLKLNNYINKFIDIITSNLSNDFNIGIYNINIKDNIYVINKDPFNNNINFSIKEENIIINENNIEINYKKNILFYDHYILNLIGYKNNKNDDITVITSGSNIININYSIINKLYYIGFDKRFYNILNIDDYYNIIINRYNNIINFIDNFIEIVTKINNNTITGIYKELFSDIKITINNIHKIKKIKNIIFNYNDFSFNNFGNNINFNTINNIQLINNIINYIIKFFINIYEINNKDNKILSFIIFYIDYSINKQFNFTLLFDKKNIMFKNLLYYKQYFDNLANTTFIEISNKDKYQEMQNELDTKNNNDNISDNGNDIDNEYNLDIDYDKDDYNEDIDDQFVFKFDE